MRHPRPLSRFVDFVRTGYPPGVHRHGYLPLFALLPRRLSDDEVAFVAGSVKVGPPIMPTDIEQAIAAVVRATPRADDAYRVSRHLADAGWLVMDGGGLPIQTSTASDAAASRSAERELVELCTAAVESIRGADLADVMLLRHGVTVSIGATSELSARLDELQHRLGEGPCVQAALDAQMIRADDFAAEHRWADYSRAAVELGVRSCLSYTLYSAGDAAATMNIFGFDAGAWDDDAEAIGADLAARAAAAITDSRWGLPLRKTEEAHHA